ncbi:histidine--tRNA ligase [Archaeoglobus fulgidus]|uniref:Histidine--tRNA ligase n=2 Tax=Archaeoglobus fulgidus TaxID=2234 RepID=SYH_ARCFU|nr:histidine--tRNA ligase [Archaeoglobus fulgidus]O28631.1 RecName: Full=Histidine--tRNA ligase; AltName: Full=Histidyl-tRNA synthetase; Short=HisRS [Archaeoglobus fulgidus DSM 4304]AAB89600.1 histidyl-tRNA synthetase (hisS) [Archaeoglobus fulgidus DSM 4304]AIG98645.1 histidyl-tRNA synthetase/ATP phosphoribosyltransferase, regulatory subunit [Archaeoglobus fulgidus DSM 8774]
MKIERPRGTRDFLPDEMERRREIEKRMRKIAESFGYREVATPTFEYLELFTRKSGEGIIEEMYVFKDKSGRDLALRPELTAPVMRMFVNECSVMPKPLRFYYFANCFRYERPQKGRYREFWQFGVELIGSESYLADAEVIILADKILKDVGVNFSLEIGHVGIMRHLLKPIGEDRASKVMRLIDKGDREGLESYLAEIRVNEDLRDKIFSLLELKGDESVIEEAKEIIDYDFGHLESLSALLRDVGVDFTLNLGIARGLDYYTGVVFECYAEGLGAQKQVCGGGSYELSSLFGGPVTPSTGFAIGFDRVCEACSVEAGEKSVVAVVSFKGLESQAFRVASMLRERGFTAVVDVMGRNLKKQMSFASEMGVKYAVILGPDEVKSGRVAIKNLETQEQVVVAEEELFSILQ